MYDARGRVLELGTARARQRQCCVRRGAGEPAAGSMLTLPPSVRIYLATAPVDLRRGHDGLFAIVRNQWRMDPFAGHRFAFVGRRGNQTKGEHRDWRDIYVWADGIARKLQAEPSKQWSSVSHDYRKSFRPPIACPRPERRAITRRVSARPARNALPVCRADGPLRRCGARLEAERIDYPTATLGP